ncbi:hypothetical protein BS17DRAFT_812789 [Gyrodon lividus]|nr:hypothetical protein BS17DRAFT_812789 [Gyrodon lividus]
MGEILKHDEFYMNTVTFLVGDCLFKVPRDPFETESTVFRDMFLLPVGDLHEVEGLNDFDPIRLEGTKKDDFEQFMRVLLHRTNGRSQKLPVDVEQWTSVLKLSTLWEFHGLRQTAIDNLSGIPVPPVEKIVLAYVYDVKSWLLPAMQELVRRPTPINMEEANRLGFETALKLASVREQLALRSVPRELVCSNYCQCANQGYRCSRDGHPKQPQHSYTTDELFPGPRANVQELDFTPILRTTFNIHEAHFD